jgi:hypothetical protein
VRKTNIYAKFSLNSSNNLNYKETSPEFIAAESKKQNKKIYVDELSRIWTCKKKPKVGIWGFTSCEARSVQPRKFPRCYIRPTIAKSKLRFSPQESYITEKKPKCTESHYILDHDKLKATLQNLAVIIVVLLVAAILVVCFCCCFR